MSRSATEIGRGLAAARAPRIIEAAERIHVVGAAGAGASAAALLARASGATVSACDAGGPSSYTEAFPAAGIPLTTGHAAAHVIDGDRPIVSRLAVTKALTAVAPDHPELRAAREHGVSVEPWQQVVADAALTHGGALVCVAGTHGKSTSSGWLVHVLTAAGRDPGAFVGALLPSAVTAGPPATARWGRGDVFVVEADEYAGNFDPYRPDLVVLLNAEWDHPDVFADEAAVLAAFEAWLRAPGADRRRLVVNAADRGAAEVANRLADWGERVVRVDPSGGGVPAIRLPGAHNVANAACVAAAAILLGVQGERAAVAIASFEGVARRLERKGEPGGVLVLDDYAHHPTAIRATIAAVRAGHPGRRLWAAHEPLTFHRTRAMLEELAEALATADEVVVADIWAGRDPDTTIASAANVAGAVRQRGGPATATGSPEATAAHLAGLVRPGDVVLVMGGGRSYVIADQLVEHLAAASPG